jgi:hypothetical protein
VSCASLYDLLHKLVGGSAPFKIREKRGSGNDDFHPGSPL